MLAREQQVFDRYRETLAALIDYVRGRALAGDDAPAIARGVRSEAKRAVGLLERGLGGYAVKP
jgi:hypothetical protein